jgi:penicillin-binding protein 2
MPFSNLPPENEGPEKRIGFLKYLFIFVFIAYGIRLFSMQILSGEVYRSRAQDIARRTTVIPAQRGEIFDRSFSQPLAMNIDSFAVNLTPAEVPRGEMPALLDRLSTILNVSRDQIERKIPAQYYYLYQPVEVAVNVPFRAIAALAENVDTLPGVSWQSKPMRNYINPASISHLLG